MLKPKKKLSRKKIKEDKLLTSVNKGIDFFNENSKIIISSLIGILVIVTVSYLYVKSKQSANTAAAGRLILAVDIYNTQNYDQAIPALLNISEQFDGTQNAGIASYYLANSYYYKENFSEARKYFKKYIDDYGDDQMFNSTALAGIASCYAHEGNKEEAANYYQSAAEKNPDLFTAADYLFSAVQIFIEMDNIESAKQLLQKLIKHYDKSTKVNEAKMLLAELTTQSS
jgi:TolA-binding protein